MATNRLLRPFQLGLRLRPSGWALLAGAVVGGAVNLLTGIRLDADGVAPLFAVLSVALLVGSSVLFAWLAILLEQLREDAPDWALFIAALEGQRRLSVIAAIGTSSLAMGITFMFWV